MFLAPKVPEVVAGGVYDISLSGGELCFSADNEGNRRTMSMTLGPRDCASVDLLTIRAETDRRLWTGSFVPTAAACAR